MYSMHIPLLANVISNSFRIGAVVVLAGAVLLFLAALGKKCRPNPPRSLKWFEKLLYAMIILGTVGLAFTGLGAVIIKAEHLEGWALMFHCAVAPLFAIGLAGFALSAADRFVCSGMAGGCCKDQAAGASNTCCEEAARHGCPLSVVFFWLALLAGAVVMFSAAVPMLPIFGTHGQEVLLKTHRYSSLAFVALLLPHAARLLRGL